MHTDETLFEDGFQQHHVEESASAAVAGHGQQCPLATPLGAEPPA